MLFQLISDCKKDHIGTAEEFKDLQVEIFTHHYQTLGYLKYLIILIQEGDLHLLPVHVYWPTSMQNADALLEPALFFVGCVCVFNRMLKQMIQI